MKKNLIKIMLVVLPLAAVVLATTTDSVKIVNQITGDYETASYFTLLPEGSLQMAPHMAGILAGLATIVSGFFLTMKKPRLLAATKWLSFAGACFAVLPMFIRGDVLMLPNVGVPILLMSQFFLAAGAKKLDLRSDKEKNGPRLDRH